MATSAAIICTNILQSFSKRGRTLRNLIVFLLVWAAQEAVTELFFQCPCYDVTPGNDVPHRRVSYSVMWMFVPTFTFWLISMMLLDNTWRCLIGCRNRPRPHPEQCCSCFWRTIGESSLAPMSWLFLIFIDGTFMECALAYTPSNCIDNNTLPSNLEVIQDKNTEARWKSTIAGLSLALSLIVIYFFATVCYQCCSSMSYYQTKYAESVQSLELDAMEEAAREENFPIFKARWKALFHGGTDTDWTDASSLPYSEPILNKKAGFIYSQFHGMRFANEKNFMDYPVMSPFGSMRHPGEMIIGVPEQRPSSSHVTNTPNNKVPAIGQKGPPPYQQEHSDQDEKKKSARKPKIRKVQVTSPPKSDFGQE